MVQLVDDALQVFKLTHWNKILIPHNMLKKALLYIFNRRCATCLTALNCWHRRLWAVWSKKKWSRLRRGTGAVSYSPGLTIYLPLCFTYRQRKRIDHAKLKQVFEREIKHVAKNLARQRGERTASQESNAQSIKKCRRLGSYVCLCYDSHMMYFVKIGSKLPNPARPKSR